MFTLPSSSVMMQELMEEGTNNAKNDPDSFIGMMNAHLKRSLQGQATQAINFNRQRATLSLLTRNDDTSKNLFTSNISTKIAEWG